MRKKLMMAIAFAGIAFGACRKHDMPPPHGVPPGDFDDRLVDFVLFTKQDFTNDTHKITFTLRIEEPNGQTWDSVLAPMLIKEIPSFPNMSVFRRQVPHGQNGLLQAGFIYEIEGSGFGPFLTDSVKPGQKLTTINYDFH